MAPITGEEVIAQACQNQGIEFMFGVVGIPVQGIAAAFQAIGGKYYGFRNEQAASYAAACVGFLTGVPGACLAVSGPGQIHGIAGLANAWSNCWPMVLLGGASFAEQESMGAFQEAPQIAAAKPFCKYAARPDSIERVPYFLEVAVRMCTHGRPGAAYIDLPANICMGQSTTEAVTFVPKCPPPPKTLADPAEVANAIELLKTAEHPLVIVGKGAAYGRAEDEMNEFMNKTQLPFLASPMGKGVVPDDSPLSVAAGRNAALSGCDVVFLVGARMNWIMHFGQPPRWAPDVKVIQLDIAAEEFGTSISTNGIDSNACRLCGDAKSVLGQLNDAVGDWSYPSGTEWWNTLLASVAKNVAFTEEAEKSDAVPMGYFRVFKELRDLLPRDAIIIAEGANTMDISRTSIPNFLPRKRLDAATFGTMGIGIGQLFAAGVVHPDQRIVAIEGDAAFGFSGMEMEAVIRYGLPVTCIVVNNNGIGGGSSRDPLEGGEENAAFEGGGADPTKWTPGNMGKETRYDLLVEALGGKAYLATTPDELRSAIVAAFELGKPSCINVLIDPRAGKKPQEHAWLTRSEEPAEAPVKAEAANGIEIRGPAKM